MTQNDERACPSCGQIFSSKLESCFNCGTWLGLVEDSSYDDENVAELDQLIHCPYCPQEHSPEAKFCPNTGKTLLHIEHPPSLKPFDSGLESAPWPQANKLSATFSFSRDKLRRIIRVLVPIILLPVLIIVFSIWLSKREGQDSPAVSLAITTQARGAGNSITTTITPIVTNPTSTDAVLITPTLTPTNTQSPPEDSTPDGLIAFVSNRSGNNDIYIMDTNGKNIRQITTDPKDDNVPSWSADGTEIAFHSNKDGDYEIYIYALETGHIRQVTYNSCADWNPAWAPDGSRFAFYSDCDGNREIYVMDIDGGNRRRLTFEEETDWFPAWSPDGNRITFTSHRSGRYYIFVMDADGSNQTSLAPGCISSFSPNGNQIIYGQYCNTDDYGAISLMKANGSNAHILDDNANRNASWSPDGSRIVFQSERTGNAEIWVMDADGGDPVLLTNNSAKDAAPVWQPGDMVWDAESIDSRISSVSPQTGDKSISIVDGMAVVFIPSGEFLMGFTTGQIDTLLGLCSGCEEEDFFPSIPSHQVYVDAFWIYQTEVTNSMYMRCVNAGACSTPENVSSQTRSYYFGNPLYGDYPVVHVNWFEAGRYCNWAGGRLPTEAEWEKAARGTDNRLFPWGNQSPNANLTNIYTYNGDTVAVGLYPTGASPYGVLDLVGNVYEWIADWYSPSYYESSDAVNPLGPERGEAGRRSVRGGSWGWGIPFASAAFRDWWEPEKAGSGVGFRCVLNDIP